MSRSLQARLERLEAKIAPPQSEDLRVHIFGYGEGDVWECQKVIPILPEGGTGEHLPGCGAACSARA